MTKPREKRETYYMTQFAEQLKKERRRLKQSQAATAEFLGISPRTLWDWEANKSAPAHLLTQDSVLEKLRNALPLK